MGALQSFVQNYVKYANMEGFAKIVAYYSYRPVDNYNISLATSLIC